jgi:hypothetical protein
LVTGDVRAEVLEALIEAIRAALDAGARTLEVKVEAEADAGKIGRAGVRWGSSGASGVPGRYPEGKVRRWLRQQ